jgi:hypothetical protein
MSTEWQQGKEAPPESLPYSEAKQDATLGHLLISEKFFTQCVTRMTSGWYVSPWTQKIWAAMQSFHARYKRAPRQHEILEAPSAVAEDEPTRARLRQRVADCLVAAERIGLDVIEHEMTAWMQARAYYAGMKRSNELYNRQDLRGAIQAVKDVSDEVAGIKFGGDSEFDPTQIDALFEAEAAELADAISFGLPAVDRLLNPSAKSGSMLKGDITCLLAPINCGKSRTMVSIACHNAKMRGKSVLLITHEDRARSIAMGVWCNLLSNPALGIYVTPGELMARYNEPATRAAMDFLAAEVWAPRICYLPLNRAGQTVEDVINAIRRKQDEWAARHGGAGFDLIVDDYPAKLTSITASKGNLAARNIIEIAYQQFRDLALEQNVHVLTAAQVNRSASKDHHGRQGGADKEKRLLTMEDVAEAWGPMMSAVNVISINRDDQSKQKQCVTYCICKSRSGETGWAIGCGSRLGSYLTHDDALGATWYRGGRSYSGVVDDLLRQFPGREVAETDLPPG